MALPSGFRGSAPATTALRVEVSRPQEHEAALTRRLQSHNRVAHSQVRLLVKHAQHGVEEQTQCVEKGCGGSLRTRAAAIPLGMNTAREQRRSNHEMN